MSKNKQGRSFMKEIIILSGSLFIIGTFSVEAQTGSNIYLDPKYGSDSLSRMECANNLSTMAEFMKLNLYDYAISPWRKVYNECPASSRNIYLYGARIYKDKIEKEKDPAVQQSLIDTLMMIYDKRIKNFGQEGLVLGKKGVDLLKYRNNAVPEAHSYLEKSVKLLGKNSEETVLDAYMKTTVFLFKTGLLKGQEVIDNYLIITDILKQKIDSGEKNQAETALSNVEFVFSESGAGSCNDLINIFTSPSNQNPEEKATYLYQLARLESTKSDQFASSRTHALEAARLKTGWGDPYILIGNLYASSSAICNENEFQQRSVFWVAIDQFVKAKSIDTSKTAEANELINRYSQYFPNVEDAFFYGYQEGQEYTVGCWINEKTKVRTRSK